MKKHPLCDIFLQRREPKVSENFVPLSHSMVVPSLSPATHYTMMGCLVLAGGLGTRFGCNGPKGCVELPLKEKKTLFEILFEKVKAKGAHLPVAIMTSPFNHAETVSYLEKNKYFGLTNVSFFSQETQPACDDAGNQCKRSDAPDGNGKALKRLYNSTIWKKWKASGVEIVQVLPIDNPLADPFDGELLAVHGKEKVELVLRGIQRNSSEEKLGIVGVENGRLSIHEYSECTKGAEAFNLGNTGIFSCRAPFIERVAEVSLPWHLAKKKRGERWVWQFETFIFDLFPYANSFKILLSDRKKCFAPLKNRLGSDGLESVARDCN